MIGSKEETEDDIRQSHNEINRRHHTQKREFVAAEVHHVEVLLMLMLQYIKNFWLRPDSSVMFHNKPKAQFSNNVGCCNQLYLPVFDTDSVGLFSEKLVPTAAVLSIKLSFKEK